MAVVILALAAQEGLREALAFLLAALADGLLRTVMALLPLAGISRLAPGLLDLLAGRWLCRPGGLVLRFAGAVPLPAPRRLWRAGLSSGAPDPRASPFALAPLSGGRGSGVMRAGALPVTCTAGFLLAALIPVFRTVTAPVRRFCRPYIRAVMRGMGGASPSG
ncbi:hypothetical protein [Pseudogemmobacter bohemicus]|uniref:hypothetical protein n=1 Tax=Pseudogemmobacter bohemicus TaxID=2250708 RepID=UPI000DD4A379|nr:hypothetical protein [Pseudogemmobacter bohemicus]